MAVCRTPTVAKFICKPHNSNKIRHNLAKQSVGLQQRVWALETYQDCEDDGKRCANTIVQTCIVGPKEDGDQERHITPRKSPDTLWRPVGQQDMACEHFAVLTKWQQHIVLVSDAAKSNIINPPVFLDVCHPFK